MNNKKEIEDKLVPRLSMMGYVLLFFSVCALTYAIVSRPYVYLPPSDEEIEEAGLGPDAFDLSEGAKINCYFIAATFAVVGAGTIFIARKKKATPEPE